jgi:hypothetical protein
VRKFLNKDQLEQLRQQIGLDRPPLSVALGEQSASETPKSLRRARPPEILPGARANSNTEETAEP